MQTDFTLETVQNITNEDTPISEEDHKADEKTATAYCTARNTTVKIFKDSEEDLSEEEENPGEIDYS